MTDIALVFLYYLNKLIFHNLYFIYICQHNNMLDINNKIISFNVNHKYSLCLPFTKKFNNNNRLIPTPTITNILIITKLGREIMIIFAIFK